MAMKNENLQMSKIQPERNKSDLPDTGKSERRTVSSSSQGQSDLQSWILENLKKKECNGFSKNKNSSMCKCGRPKSDHPNQEEKSEWKTSEVPTDAYGELEFYDSDNQLAKFVRLSDKSDAAQIANELLLERWNLQKPNLLISVTGGAVSFDMKSRLKEVFRLGLQKAAESTGAWIITGGTNVGVMKHVGEAVKEIKITDDKNQVVAIGVAPWGCIRNRDELVSPNGKWPHLYSVDNSSIKDEIFLDPNHTHFILVDNGTQHAWQSEISFRSALEKAISEMKIETVGEEEARKIPVVLLVLQGGPGTFQTIHGAIKNSTPIVVIKDTGGAADILAIAFQRACVRGTTGKDEHGQTVRSTYLTLDEDVKDELFKMMENYKKEVDKNKIMDMILEIIQSKDLLTIFELNSRSSTQSVDMAILRALMKDNRNDVMDQLELALVWDKIDVAKKDILGDDQVDKKTLKLADKMLTAIERDRVSFVDLFMDYGVNLKQFLTCEKLLELYNKIPKNCFLRTLLSQLNKRKKNDDITFADIHNLLQHLLGDYYTPYYGKGVYKDKHRVDDGIASATNLPLGVAQLNDATAPTKPDHPVQDLFIWCLLMNRQEMAKLFWAELDEPIAAALFANSLYKALLTKSHDTEISLILQNNADEFEALSIGVLNSCYEKDEDKSQNLLTRELSNWGDTTCVIMAVQADNKRFISQTACQTLLNSIWMGKLAASNSTFKLFVISIFFPVLWSLLKFDEKKIEENMNKRKETSNGTDNQYGSKINIWKKIKYFYLAPATIFCLNVITYLIFLVLFAYHILVSFNENFTVVEGIICGWVVTICVEELRQLLVHTVYTSNARSVGSKLKAYFTDSWNILDLLTIFLFATSMILRFIPDDTTFKIARVLLSLNFVTFCFRILHIFSVNKQLGPKLVMINRMVGDLSYFVVILIVFIISYAVATEAVLYPNTELSWALLYHIPRKAYWQIYGELFLETIEGEETCSNNPADYANYEQLRCPSEWGKYFAPIALGCYVMMTNVLLLNLLIAMFSYTFQKIQDNTDLHWYFQYYQLVHEYYSRPFLPPPAIIIVHVYLIFKFLKDKCFNSADEKSDFRKKYVNKQEERQLVMWERVIGKKFRNRQEQLSIEDVHHRYTNVLTRLEEMTSKDLDLKDGFDTRDGGGGHIEHRVNEVEQRMKLTHKALEYIMTSLEEHSMSSKKMARPKLYDVKKKAEKDKRKKLRSQQLHQFFKSEFRLHSKCRNGEYCNSGIQRLQISDEEVLWVYKKKNYSPERYTHPKILSGEKQYADHIDLLNASEEDKAKFKFNSFDDNFKCDRRSFAGEYEIKHGLPLNPKGRTGLQGRGELGRWGPNYTIDCVVTRWINDEDEVETTGDEEKKCFMFVGIKRSDDSQQFAIPGDLVQSFEDPTTSLKDALFKVFAEKVLGYSKKTSGERTILDECLSKLVNKGEVIFEGYADDRRNTDNAWIETRVIHYHDEDGTISQDFNKWFQAGRTAQMAAWLPYKDSFPLWGDHAGFLSQVAEKLNATN